MLFHRYLDAAQPAAIERLIPLCELVRASAGDRQRGDESPLAVLGCSEVSHPGLLSCRTGCG